MMEKERRKENNYIWAVTELKKLVENRHFGSVTFNIQNGSVDKLKIESYLIPDIDESQKKN